MRAVADTPSLPVALSTTCSASCDVTPLKSATPSVVSLSLFRQHTHTLSFTRRRAAAYARVLASVRTHLISTSRKCGASAAATIGDKRLTAQRGDTFVTVERFQIGHGVARNRSTARARRRRARHTTAVVVVVVVVVVVGRWCAISARVARQRRFCGAVHLTFFFLFVCFCFCFCFFFLLLLVYYNLAPADAIHSIMLIEFFFARCTSTRREDKVDYASKVQSSARAKTAVVVVVVVAMAVPLSNSLSSS